MEPILSSLTAPSPTAFVTLAFAILVIGGGIYATLKSLRKPTYDAALAYGVGGFFAVIFLLALGHIVYVFDMGWAQDAISRANVAERPLLLAQAERRAMASIYIAFLGAMLATPMAIYLLVRALRLRTSDSDDAAETVRPASVGNDRPFLDREQRSARV